MEGTTGSLVKAVTTVLERTFPSAQILDVSISPGSKKGQNYLSTILALDIQLVQKQGLAAERKFLVLKTSSENEVLHSLVTQLQVFDKEITFYQEVIPELVHFQQNKYGSQLITPAFVECLGAQSVSTTDKPNPEGTNSNCLPWHYILMQDVRADGGYRMADCFAGLDFAHCKLALTELANYHALTYAYLKSLKAGTTSVFDKFPNLAISWWSAEHAPTMLSLSTHGMQMSLEILSRTFPQASSDYNKLDKLITGIAQIAGHFRAGSSDLDLDEMLSTQVVAGGIDLERRERNQWLVLAHGDPHTNNFLFKYSNDQTPTAIKFLDLQTSTEACLTTDLAYFFYLSTTAQLRATSLNDLLRVYYETFKSACDRLNVEPWSDFSFENLQHKFKRSMVYGASMAMLALPSVLIPKEPAPETDTMSKGDTTAVAALEPVNAVVQNEILETRLVGIAKEYLAFDLF